MEPCVWFHTWRLLSQLDHASPQSASADKNRFATYHCDENGIAISITVVGVAMIDRWVWKIDEAN